MNSDVSTALLHFSEHRIIVVVLWTVLVVGLLQSFVYLLQLWFAFREIRSRHHMHGPLDTWNLLTSNMAMPISILIPAHNEDVTICDSVRATLSLMYSPFEVIVINDGSRDDTLQTLIDTFDLKPIQRAYQSVLPHKRILGIYGSESYPRLLLVDKENGGKADALNAGIALSRCPLFCTIDADSILEPQALLRAVQPFLEDPGRVIAVGGTVRIANGCDVRHGHIQTYRLSSHPLVLLQTIEYLRAFLLARLSWSRIGVLTIVSGAFGIFKRNVVVEAGGYTLGCVGEDFEVVLKLHQFLRKQRRNYRMVYLSDPICWTEAPETLRGLSLQRRRWQRGALESIVAHWTMIGNWRYGRLGMLGMPLVLLNDVLGPAVELLGLVLLPVFCAKGLISVEFTLAYFALTICIGVFISSLSLLLEGNDLDKAYNAQELRMLAIVAVLENFGYRQLNTLWRVIASIEFLSGYVLGRSHGWEKETRRGFKHRKPHR